MSPLTSNQLQFRSAKEAVEYFYEKGWTDGLPVIPPTPELVGEMLKQVGLEGHEVLGTVPERNRVITAEKVAINAVMAGCLPIYMPVVVAAVEAILDPAFGVHGPTASTGGSALMVIINGPIIHQIGLNTGKNLMANTNRANATIGRAISLLMKNAGGTGQFDQTTIGHPGKLSFCIAEAENEHWLPLHVERGFQREESTVTVFAALGPHQLNNHVANTPEGILLSIADSMTNMASFHMQRGTQCAIVICPEHFNTLVDAGWDKQRAKSFLYEHARRPRSDFYRFGVDLNPPSGEEEWATAVPSPDDILLVMGGGPAGRFSSFIPGWGSVKQTVAVTKRISASGFT